MVRIDVAHNAHQATRWRLEQIMGQSEQVARQGRRAGVHGVHSVNRFVFTVPDLDVAQRFYETFGLRVTREATAGGERLMLGTFEHKHQWGEVHELGAVKELQYLSYGIDAEDEPIMRERIAQAGVGCEPHPLSDGQGLWLRNPDGTPWQLIVADKVSPDAKSPAVPIAAVERGQGAAPHRGDVKTVYPRYLSHVLFFTPDVQRMLDFCTDVVGLRLSDRSGDGIAFIHGVHGSDHHLVAFAKSNAPGLHHSSWDVGRLDDVGCGAEQMQAAGYTKGWGVGRHVLGSNYFYYVRDPWGSYAEYSFDIDYVPNDLDWPAADHLAHDSLYVWGPPVPADFITNFEPAALAAETAQASALALVPAQPADASVTS
jgi:catechol 2,3-dioxygenase-like lactoylglutathione lyase family enzyme